MFSHGTIAEDEYQTLNRYLYDFYRHPEKYIAAGSILHHSGKKIGIVGHTHLKGKYAINQNSLETLVTFDSKNTSQWITQVGEQSDIYQCSTEDSSDEPEYNYPDLERADKELIISLFVINKDGSWQVDNPSIWFDVPMVREEAEQKAIEEFGKLFQKCKQFDSYPVAKYTEFIDLTKRKVNFIMPGAVGQPREGVGVFDIPVAHYMTIQQEETKITIERREVPYDVLTTSRKILSKSHTLRGNAKRIIHGM